jgi:flagellar M-ring protein FliF
MERKLQNLVALWSNLSLQRRLVVLGATGAVFFAILALGTLRSNSGVALLFAGLDGAASGAVIAALDQQGAQYEVRGNAIYVPEEQRDVLRMTLAAQGLPAVGSAGYELLDTLSGFGTTSQMFDAAYWRAKEGELARTIQSNPAIRTARVHIASAPSTPFHTQTNPTASVMVATSSGSLAPEYAQALRHLVAAAVPGLLPKDVALIDGLNGLVIDQNEDLPLGGSADDRAASLKSRLEKLLEARVGPGKAIVEVAIEVETDREETRERVFDPNGRVAISSETEERTDSSGTAGGEVTVASNLPDGDAGQGTSEQSQSSTTSERVNYEVSETSRETIRMPGATRKLSVAVLLDEAVEVAADGTESRVPRTEEELTVLTELVASAVGFDEERGDVLTVKSLAFQPLPISTEGTEAVAAAWISGTDLMQIIQIAVLATVALVLGLFVLRPVLMSANNQRARIGANKPPLALPSLGASAAPLSEDATAALDGEIQDDIRQLDFGSTLRDAAQDANTESDPVSRLRRLIEERQTESVEILRGWMEKEEEQT